MTVLELLQSDKVDCFVQGSHTRIIRNAHDGTFEVLQKRSNKRKDFFGNYTVQLYHGVDEEDAVTAFIAGEKL